MSLTFWSLKLGDGIFRLYLFLLSLWRKNSSENGKFCLFVTWGFCSKNFLRMRESMISFIVLAIHLLYQLIFGWLSYMACILNCQIYNAQYITHSPSLTRQSCRSKVLKTFPLWQALYLDKTVSMHYHIHEGKLLYWDNWDI